ncbi:citrate transporter [Pokkaliibacter plantistimulans]|uniref:Citrate transporter n=1 Tax=Proteobacteria bacterium 228 TaxID=2083153 RepID=A0A2S5KGS9_9PROT|nr:citrate:proton symporter [Pokkaliibacter plantistimulans]PPC73970.1 citrate transporter [Pokkaliibacter plantistimulans]
MITTLGFVMMLGIIALILLKRLTPVVAFALVPVVICMLAGYTPAKTGEFIKSGLTSVAPTATLFIFAILYFGIMRERGMFDPLVNLLIRSTRGKPMRVTVVTVLVAAIAHLDGVGAATFLLTIPALLPLYQRLKISPTALLCLVGLSAGIVNMVPWGGPTARAAATAGVDASALWLPLVPVQILGIGLMLALAVYFGRKAERNLAAENLQHSDMSAYLLPPRATALPTGHWRYWANVILTLIILVILFTGAFPLYAAFMVGLAIALLLNYPGVEEQSQHIAVHAKDALQMALVMLAAGILLGVLKGTGMSNGMATALIDILPNGSASVLHLIVGAFGVPLGMLFSPDAYYFALMPIVRDISLSAGVPVEAVARAMLIGENTGFSISPVVPSVYLAIGLAGVELREHIKFTFFWAWGIGIILLAFASLTGAIGG